MGEFVGRERDGFEQGEGGSEWSVFSLLLIEWMIQGNITKRGYSKLSEDVKNDVFVGRGRCKAPKKKCSLVEQIGRPIQ